jgi:hypothetical protein
MLHLYSIHTNKVAKLLIILYFKFSAHIMHCLTQQLLFIFLFLFFKILYTD